MANHPQQPNHQKLSISPAKKALIAFLIGTLATSMMYYFFKKSKVDLTNPILSQDSFQGPAELSTAIQISCQDSAKKIFDLSKCSDKESEFIKNAANCLNVYYSLELDNDHGATADGNYGDMSLQIAQCYSAVENSNPKAVDFLKKITAQFDWDVYMGPISCDSKSTLAAYIETYSENRTFKCVKIADLPNLISEFKNKNFKSLKSMMANGQVANQGIIEADVNCPEPLVNIEKNLTKLTTTAFEITDPKLESGAPDDIFIEMTRNKNRLLNLQFKIRGEGCLHFQSLLAPSTETE